MDADFQMEHSRTDFKIASLSEKVQFSKKEFFGKRNPERYQSFGKRNQPTCFAFKKGACPKGDAFDYWYPLECSYQQEGACKLGNKCGFKHAVVAKTLDITRAAKEITSFQSTAKGDFLHGVSGFPEKSILRKVCTEVVKTVPLILRRDTFCSRAREEWPHSRSYILRTSNPKVAQIILKRTWKLFARKPWTCTRNLYKARGNLIQTRFNLIRPPNRSTQEEFVASRYSGSSLHTMRKNAFLSDERKTIRTRQIPPSS